MTGFPQTDHGPLFSTSFWEGGVGGYFGGRGVCGGCRGYGVGCYRGCYGAVVADLLDHRLDHRHRLGRRVPLLATAFVGTAVVFVVAHVFKIL